MAGSGKRCKPRRLLFLFWRISQARELTPTPSTRDRFRFAWHMDIKIEGATDGVMTMTVDAGPNGDGNLQLTTLQHEQNSIIPPNQEENIKNFISAQLKANMDVLRRNLQVAFQNSGKFVYPGNGTFKFFNPVIGNSGEILAELEYKP